MRTACTRSAGAVSGVLISPSPFFNSRIIIKRLDSEVSPRLSSPTEFEEHSRDCMVPQRSPRVDRCISGRIELEGEKLPYNEAELEKAQGPMERFPMRPPPAIWDVGFPNGHHDTFVISTISTPTGAFISGYSISISCVPITQYLQGTSVKTVQWQQAWTCRKREREQRIILITVKVNSTLRYH